MAVFPLPTLHAERVLVRAVDAQDLPALMDVNGDPQVTAFLPYAPWQSLLDAQAWLARMLALRDAGTGCQMVVAEQPGQRVIGTCLVFRHEVGSRRAELGYVLGRAHWGRGLMREALTAVLDHVFTGGHLRRVEAEINPANVASSRLAVALGFTCEGLLRQRWTALGPGAKSYDTNIYGLLAGEWRSAPFPSRQSPA